MGKLSSETLSIQEKSLGLPKIASLLFITTLDTRLHTAKQYLR